jgi:RNA polymerase sigma factor (sigma-70 family)
MRLTEQKVLKDVLEKLARSRTDEEAWRVLFKVLWPFVFTFNYRLLRGNRPLAEDASQEVLTRLVQYTDFVRIHDPDALLSYARVICKNVIRTMQSRSSREQLFVARDDLDDSVDDAPDPERALASSEKLDQIMAKLAPPDRALVTMIRKGLSLEEIASQTGQSYSTLGVRLHRLRKSLLREFGK